MTSRVAVALVVAVVVVAAGVGAIVYFEYFAPSGPADSENWAGYLDPHGVGSASATISLPANGEWHGDGVASLWVGMGGAGPLAAGSWPFWQAGVLVTCSLGYCSAELFDEGGTQGAPCNGVCPVNWTQDFGVQVGDSITVTVSGGASGATAVLVVDNDGFNSTYRPPPWTVLAGTYSFPSAEWIFEAPSGAHGMEVMPTLSPPGVVFSSLADSNGPSVSTPISMQDNPNGQSVNVSALSGGTFSAYSWET